MHGALRKKRIPWANAHRLADDCARDLTALDNEAIANIQAGRTILRREIKEAKS